MKIIYAFILLIVVICWNSHAIASEESSKNNNGLTMRVFSNKDTFEKNDPIPIWLEIQNKSNNQYSIFDDHVGIINFFSVFDSQGEKVPYSPQTLRNLTPSIFFRGRSLELKIPPGTSKKFEVTSNLLKSIDIQKSEKYSYHPTVFLYHEKKGRLINVKVQRVRPFNFTFKGDNNYTKNYSKNLNKLIELKCEQQQAVAGLKIKSIRINSRVLDARDKNNIAELFVEVKNVSKDKYPAFQWFGRYDMILWDSKIFHNKKIVKGELFSSLRYSIFFNKIKYNFWYDVISPGETRSFKIILKPNSFPDNISENKKFIDLNGSWDIILSRKVYLVKNGKYNTMKPSELLKYEKKLILPKILLILKRWSKAEVDNPTNITQ